MTKEDFLSGWPFTIEGRGPLFIYQDGALLTLDHTFFCLAVVDRNEVELTLYPFESKNIGLDQCKEAY